jgi:quercetin dioxygenase-like cupin family protein
MRSSLRVAAVLTACMLSAMSAIAHGPEETVSTALNQPLPNIPGKSLVAVIVDYPPSGGSAAHSHARSAFIYGYVVSGAIESQVNDGPPQILQAGESFYEPPGAVHRLSRNASRAMPAKLLAVFVVNTEETALTTPLP